MKAEIGLIGWTFYFGCCHRHPDSHSSLLTATCRVYCQSNYSCNLYCLAYACMVCNSSTFSQDCKVFNQANYESVLLCTLINDTFHYTLIFADLFRVVLSLKIKVKMCAICTKCCSFLCKKVEELG